MEHVSLLRTLALGGSKFQAIGYNDKIAKDILLFTPAK
jgi:hypothetical protein